MQEYSTTANANGSEFAQTGAAANVKTLLSPTESTAPTAADPLAAANMEEPSMSTAAGAPATPSTIPAPVAVSANLVTSDSKDEAGAKGQVPAAPSDIPKNNPLPTAEGEVTQTAEIDHGGCFEPFIPQVPVPLSPKPAPEPKPISLMPVVDRVLRDDGLLCTPTETTPEEEFPTPATDGSTSAAEKANSGEFLTAPVEATLPPPRVATTAELITWIKRVLLAQTILPEDAAELVAFWVLSTFFQSALTVLPCLVLTGAPHEASSVLRVLGNLCCEARLLSGFRRSHLGVLQRVCKTNLVSEPNLDKRTAALLSNLTDRNFVAVERGSLISCAKSTAIFAGESPETHKIQNSIHIHIAPTNAGLPPRPQWLHKMIDRLPVHLGQYRKENLGYVRRWTWIPTGLSSETAAIAAALGRCATNAPELRQKLVTLLKTHDQQRQSEQSNTIEAVVLESLLTLCRDAREQVYAREIAAAANHLLEARGETARLSPEKVGHRLLRIGLRARRLSQTGNGLIFDKATIAQIKQLAAMYGVEDTPAKTENLHSQQTAENK
jgi:hypothetical protein